MPIALNEEVAIDLVYPRRIEIDKDRTDQGLLLPPECLNMGIHLMFGLRRGTNPGTIKMVAGRLERF